MTKPTLYYALFSPPARACMITAKLIGLDVDLRFVDFAKKEHLSEEFIKLNPQHQIPVLIDENEPYWDSHAIMAYIVSKYAKTDNLYPKDLSKRARVDQRMHYENGVLFQVIKDLVPYCEFRVKEYQPGTITLHSSLIVSFGRRDLHLIFVGEQGHTCCKMEGETRNQPYCEFHVKEYQPGTITFHSSLISRIIYGGETEYNEKTIQNCHSAYEFLEKFLENQNYVVGSELTIADISINTTLITLHRLIPVEKDKYPNIIGWMERLKSLPDNEEVNEKGAEQLAIRIKSCLADNQSKA